MLSLLLSVPLPWNALIHTVSGLRLPVFVIRIKAMSPLHAVWDMPLFDSDSFGLQYIGTNFEVHNGMPSHPTIEWQEPSKLDSTACTCHRYLLE
ncbi:hypothetical protein K440DRAFT_11775 [Wilcoxina mikolae CBS 423.85]|nr:hypothetical protein K440DRAFT_11775 [Wilcoxina mikolae CBS 423.85]